MGYLLGRSSRNQIFQLSFTGAGYVVGLGVMPFPGAGYVCGPLNTATCSDVYVS